MNALGRFESFVENLIEGSIAKALRARLEPVELAKRLARAMEAEQVMLPDRTLVPNEYRLELNPEDFQPYEGVRTALEQELVRYVANRAREANLVLPGPPIVHIEPSPRVPRHQVQVAARMIEAPPSAPAGQFTQKIPTIRPGPPIAPPARAPAGQGGRLVVRQGSVVGTVFPLDRPAVTIGRALENDIVLEDARVSRFHAEIVRRDNRLWLRDLRSTNGTQVNGQSGEEWALRHGDRITLGSVELIFEASG